MPPTREDPPSADLTHVSTPDLATVYEAHADFVWLILQRLGVRSGDLEDMMQEVFIVVHRKLPEWRADGTMESFLYSICRRLMANYRRRAHNDDRRSEELEPELAVSEGESPEQAAESNEARARLETIMSGLSDDKRVVFVMFELELRSPSEIAATLSIPIGTVYSRVHAARQELERAAARLALTPENHRK